MTQPPDFEAMATELFNSNDWCWADNASIRGLADHVPLLAKALRAAHVAGLEEGAGVVQNLTSVLACSKNGHGLADALRSRAEQIRKEGE